jgi:flagellar basal-body rod protein FlgB
MNMGSSLFGATTIPVLEQVVQFAQSRHGVLAGNIANLDTPGYKTRDLSPQKFQESLASAIESKNYPGGPGSAGAVGASRRDLEDVADSMRSIMYHDESNVGIEKQIAEMTKNQQMHDLALALLTSQFRLLQAAISERA